MKKILIVLLSIVTLLNTSCDDYLDVNKNVDAPDYIEAELYLPGVQAAWQGCYWDIRALGPLPRCLEQVAIQVLLFIPMLQVQTQLERCGE